jgi:vancomycin permeability regulator SanA
MRKLLRWLLILLLGLIALWSIAALILIINGLNEQIEPADVAVILGNEVYLSGEPSPQLKGRLDRAVELFQQQLFPQIVVSGAIETNGIDESLGMRQYLVTKGVPAQAIFLDPRGFDTMNTAEDTAALMSQHGWKRIMVISQYFHLPRCKLAFRKAGIKHVLVSYARFFSWRDLWAITRELVAYPVYWLETPAQLMRNRAAIQSWKNQGLAKRTDSSHGLSAGQGSGFRPLEIQWRSHS